MLDRNNSEAHHRRSIRLPGYDYAQAGAYFVTLCAHERTCLFGEIVDGAMLLHERGQIVTEEWLYIALIRPYVALDEFVVMPNHLHAVVVLTGDVRRRAGSSAEEVRPASAGDHQRRLQPDGRLQPSCCTGTHPTNQRPRSPSRTIGAIVRGFKAAATSRINMTRGTRGMPVWQRNYYEHVIRNDDDLDRIRTYITNNPARWAEDENNPQRSSNAVRR